MNWMKILKKFNSQIQIQNQVFFFSALFNEENNNKIAQND